MIQCPIPNAVITKYKPKVVFGFTLRQLICGSLGIIFGLAVGFFWLFKNMAIDNRAIFSGLLASPFFIVGWGSIYGQPIEKMLVPIFIDNFLTPAVRKKEVHHKEMEDYEKTLKFMMPKEPAESETLDGNKKKKPTQTKTPKKIKVKKSQTYKAIM